MGTWFEQQLQDAITTGDEVDKKLLAHEIEIVGGHDQESVTAAEKLCLELMATIKRSNNHAVGLKSWIKASSTTAAA